MRIAVLGFGVMGQTAAAKLAASGYQIVASDPDPSTEGAAARMKIDHFSEPVVDADVVLLFLPGPRVIREVMPRLLSGINKVIVDHSTADPSTAQDMAALAQAQGVGWIDAPVLGRPSSVGNWCLPCGATQGALDIARPLFAHYAREIYDMGAPGNGHKVKLLNQMMFGAINAMTAEMMATSDALGLPPARLFEILSSSKAGTVSNLFLELGARITQDNYSDPVFSVQLLAKDIDLGLQMARGAGLNPELGAIVDVMNKRAIERGHSAEDTAGMWRSVPRG